MGFKVCWTFELRRLEICWICWCKIFWISKIVQFLGVIGLRTKKSVPSQVVVFNIAQLYLHRTAATRLSLSSACFILFIFSWGPRALQRGLSFNTKIWVYQRTRQKYEQWLRNNKKLAITIFKSAAWVREGDSNLLRFGEEKRHSMRRCYNGGCLPWTGDFFVICKMVL